MTQASDHALASETTSFQQELATRFLSRVVSRPGAHWEGDVHHLVTRPLMPFRIQWKQVRAVLAQDFLVLIDLSGSRVEFCECVAAITDVAVDTESEGDGQAAGPPSRGPSRPRPNTQRGRNGDTPRSATRQSPFGALRITFRADARKKELLFWSKDSCRLAEALADARSHLGVSGEFPRRFVPVEWMKHWVSQRIRSSSNAAEVQIVPCQEECPRERMTAGLQAIVLIWGVMRKAKLWEALRTLRRWALLVKMRETATANARRLGACAQRAAGQVALAEAFQHWRHLAGSPPTRDGVAVREVQCFQDPLAFDADALAQELVEEWEPLWAYRAVVLQRSLQPIVRLALAVPLECLHTTAATVRSCAGGGTAVGGVAAATAASVAFTLSMAHCRCLVLVVKRCIRHRLGDAWRVWVCAGEQLGVAEALDALDAQLDGAAEELVAENESSAQLLGARRLACALRRSMAWWARVALLHLQAFAALEAPASGLASFGVANAEQVHDSITELSIDMPRVSRRDSREASIFSFSPRPVGPSPSQSESEQ